MIYSRRFIRDLLLSRPQQIRYGAHRCRRCDLFVPEGPGPHPVAVVIHGGYWRAKYGRRVTRPISADLARRGVAAWNIEYRRLGRGQGGGWPMTFDDVAAAIDHLAEIADPRLDLTSVSAVGHSAGGQLAIWAAARSQARVPIARVVALGAVLDMRAAGERAATLLGAQPDEAPDRWASTDPMQLLPLGVPTLLLHGADDETVPVIRARRYAEAALAAGDEVELIEPVPGGHRVHLDPHSSSWEAALAWLGREGVPLRGDPVRLAM